jgi:hypothetical protein
MTLRCSIVAIVGLGCVAMARSACAQGALANASTKKALVHVADSYWMAVNAGDTAKARSYQADPDTLYDIGLGAHYIHVAWLWAEEHRLLAAWTIAPDSAEALFQFAKQSAPPTCWLGGDRRFPLEMLFVRRDQQWKVAGLGLGSACV